MIKLTPKKVSAISIIMSVISFYLIGSCWVNYDKSKLEESVDSSQIQESKIYNFNEEKIENSVTEDTNETEIVTPEKKDKENKFFKNKKWSIEIPVIGLYAEIAEGTTKKVMDKYVGHFEETQIESGNIGLAAHNRGYPVNYFKNLKNLKVGNQIIYRHADFEMTYYVHTIQKIENTNWDYLENTNDNRITLITCVENQPKYRRCIQGIEK